MLNKRGLADTPHEWISVILGLILLVYSVLAILGSGTDGLGKIAVKIPSLPGLLTYILLVVAALLFVWDGLKNGKFHGTEAILSFGLGFVFVIAGGIPLLHTMGIIGFSLPNFVNSIVTYLFAVGGAVLTYMGLFGA